MGYLVEAMNYLNTYSIILCCIFLFLFTSAYWMIENPATASIGFIVGSESLDVHWMTSGVPRKPKAVWRERRAGVVGWILNSLYLFYVSSQLGNTDFLVKQLYTLSKNSALLQKKKKDWLLCKVSAEEEK